MNSFPDTVWTATDSCLFWPEDSWEVYGNANTVLDALWLHRTSTQYTKPLAQRAPDEHECNVPAITVCVVAAAEQPQHRPPPFDPSISPKNFPSSNRESKGPK